MTYPDAITWLASVSGRVLDAEPGAVLVIADVRAMRATVSGRATFDPTLTGAARDHAARTAFARACEELRGLLHAWGA